MEIEESGCLSFLRKRALVVLLIPILFAVGCGSSDQRSPKITDTNSVGLAQVVDSSNSASEASVYADSITKWRIIAEALSRAGRSKKEIFAMQYSVAQGDDSALVQLQQDHLFSSSSLHLLVKVGFPGSLYFAFFCKSAGKYVPVLQHEQWSMEYVNDSIWDVNGDGRKDFVVNWYGANGSWLKGFSDVYLLRKDASSFTNQFEFINPTFSVKEHMVRGICYGQPGETEMYKCRWSGETLDTVEFVSHERDENGKRTGIVILAKDEGDEPQHIIKTLRHVPAEYRTIAEFSWFMGMADSIDNH